MPNKGMHWTALWRSWTACCTCFVVKKMEVPGDLKNQKKRFRPKNEKIGSTKNIQKPTYRTSCLERLAQMKGQCGNHRPHSKLLERVFGGKQGGEPLAVRFVAQVAGKALPNHSNWTAEQRGRCEDAKSSRSSLGHSTTQVYLAGQCNFFARASRRLD